MGDRSNIKIIDSNEGSFYLYAHWLGADNTRRLHKALKRGKSRWGDESYMSRIIFCTLVEGHEQDLTGYGLSTFMPDNGNPITVVDMRTMTVTFENQNNDTWTFEEYVALDPETLPARLLDM